MSNLYASLIKVSQSEFFIDSDRRLGGLKPIVLSMVLYPVNDSLGISFSIELDGLSTLVLAVPENGGISGDLHTFDFIESTIKVSQDDVGVMGEGSSCGFEVRSDALAVSAPGSIDFDQILLIIPKDEVLVGAADERLHGLVIALGNGSRLEQFGNISIIYFHQKGLNSLSSDRLSGKVLVPGFLKEHNFGGFLHINAKVLGEPAEVISVGSIINHCIEPA